MSSSSHTISSGSTPSSHAQTPVSLPTPQCSPGGKSLAVVEQLLAFLKQAPSLFNSPLLPQDSIAPFLVRLHLPLPHYNESITCISHKDSFLITGTDILRILMFRFQCLGRPITLIKKFEEGVFSDLRSLKVGSRSQLEPSRSPLLDALHKFGCIRTQKRQKVFLWEAVDHDRLFRDAWEREERREGDAIPVAVEDTDAVLDNTHPLLVTYVNSSEDAVEHPLNATETRPASPKNEAEYPASQTGSHHTVSQDYQNELNATLSMIPDPVSQMLILEYVAATSTEAFATPAVLDHIGSVSSPRDLERRQLMAELEAFLTPPKDAASVDMMQHLPDMWSSMESGTSAISPFVEMTDIEAFSLIMSASPLSISGMAPRLPGIGSLMPPAINSYGKRETDVYYYDGGNKRVRRDYF